MPRSLQTAFNSGELSPSLHSHADLGKYRAGLAKCENFFVLAQGGATTRPGMKYIGPTTDYSSVSRMITFQFNTEQSYGLVFQDTSMRVIRDGGLVLEPSLVITAATSANPVSITTSGAHGYVTGQEVFIASVGGMTQINNRYWPITVTGATTFTLDGSLGLTYDAYTSGGTVARVFGLLTPYAAADLAQLKFVQSADVMTITHPSHAPRQLSRSSHYNWTLSTITYAASIGPPTTNLVIAPVGTASGSNNTVYQYVITSVSEDGDESVVSAILNSGSMNALSATYGNKLTWDPVVGAEYYNIYKEFSVFSGIFGWLGEASNEEFHDYNFGPDMSVTPPIAKNPFSGADNRPACTTYHQQRQWFGCTNNQPDTIWATRTADYDNMDVSRPTRADDAIEATLAAQEVNEIRHMVSLDDLLLFTSGAEWKVQGDADGVITPANLNIRTQGFRGSSHVRPLIIGDTALFVQEKGSRVRDIKYTFESDKYVGNDLTVLARHMFEGYEIRDWCYSQEPYSIVWAVRGDGVLLALTYLREHDVYAWSRHITDGEFESVCAVSEGQYDVLYAVVKRTVGGFTVRYIERMETRLIEIANRAFCVDSGLTYTGEVFFISAITQANPAVVSSAGHTLVDDDVVRITAVEGMTDLNNLYYRIYDAVAGVSVKLKYMDGTPVDTSAMPAFTGTAGMQKATSTVTGLYHLLGESVVALADGNVVTDLTVDNVDGTVDLPNPAVLVHVGLPYCCDLETLEVSFQNEVIPSRKKQVARVAIRVEKSRGLQVGPNFDEMYDFRERSPAEGYDNLLLFTGQQVQEMARAGWSDTGKVCIRQDKPLPATVLAVIPEIDVSV